MSLEHTNTATETVSPTRPPVKQLTLFVHPETGMRSFYRNYAKSGSSDLAFAKKMGGWGWIKIQVENHLIPELEEAEVRYALLQTTDKNNIPHVIGVQAIAANDWKKLKDAGFLLVDEKGQELTDDQLQWDPEQEKAARALHADRLRREREQKPATAAKRKNPSDEPPKRDFRDWKKNLSVFIAHMDYLRSLLPEDFDTLSDEEKQCAIRETYKNPEIGRRLSQGNVLHHMLMQGTNASNKEIVKMFGDIKTARGLSLDERNLHHYFTGDLSIPAQFTRRVETLLRLSCANDSQTQKFEESWHLYQTLPNKHLARDVDLAKDLKNLCQKHSITEDDLLDSKPFTKAREYMSRRLRHSLNGIKSPDPDTIDDLISRMHAIAIKQDNPELLADIASLCESHEIPYNTEKGYCIESYEDLVERYREEGRPLLSVMLRDIRSVRELRISINDPDLGSVLEKKLGSLYYEHPRTYTSKPTSTELDAFITYFRKKLAEKSVTLHEDHGDWLIEANRGDYPAFDEDGSEIPIENYHASHFDPWAKFHRANQARNRQR